MIRNMYHVFKQVISPELCKLLKKEVDRYAKKQHKKTLQRLVNLSKVKLKTLSQLLQPALQEIKTKLELPITLSNVVTVTKRTTSIGWHVDQYISKEIVYKCFLQLSDRGRTRVYDSALGKVVTIKLERGDVFMFSMDMIHSGGPSKQCKYLLGFRPRIKDGNYTRKQYEKHRCTLNELLWTNVLN